MKRTAFILLAAMTMLSGASQAATPDSNAGASSSPYCTSRPMHAMPLSMLPEDYPLLSVAQDEQGSVMLDFLIKTDGSITDVKVARSSGFARLDGAAADIAGQRWHFDPVVVNGRPVSCRNKVVVDWVLSLSTEQMEQAGFVVEHMTASDFPPGSFARHETGQTLVMVVTRKDGKIQEAMVQKSSGFADLDQQAIDYITHGRWTITPAQVSGQPVMAAFGFVIVWGNQD
ncbi:MAG TPA: TonB family protein [Rhizomicrobium sp.]|jgi:TonB family protein